MDLTHLSLAELRTLDTKTKKELEKREQQEVAIAREQIQAIAQSAGISLKDLIASSSTPRKKSGPAAVKYRNPDNNAQQWTGRGRQPKWVKEWLDSGKSLDLLGV